MRKQESIAGCMMRDVRYMLTCRYVRVDSLFIAMFMGRRS